jgi:hypothetical protein
MFAALAPVLLLKEKGAGLRIKSSVTKQLRGGDVEMLHTDIQTLINRGRRAGLRTSELYNAIGARPPELHEATGQADSNGFISGYTATGRRVFHPSGGYPRP